MTVIKDEIKEVVAAMSLQMYHGEQALVAAIGNENTSWPLVVMDIVRGRSMELTAANTLQYSYVVNMIFLQQDEPESAFDSDNLQDVVNNFTPSSDIIDAMRLKAGEFIHRIANKVDVNGRKIFMRVELGTDEVFKKWSSGMLSGVLQPITLFPMDKSILC